MKEKDILNRIAELRKDDRLCYPTADVFSNAPLALIQLQLGTELNTLEKVLDLKPSKIPLKKK